MFFKRNKRPDAKSKETQKSEEKEPDLTLQVKGFVDEYRIDLGEYHKFGGDREGVSLFLEDNNWILSRYILTTNHQDGGGGSSYKIDSEFFASRNIFTLDAWIKSLYFYTTHLKPCIELIKEHKDVLAFMDELIRRYTTPNYNADGISLLYQYDEQQGGIVINKCFSDDADEIIVPTMIDNLPVVGFGASAFSDLKCRELILPDTLKTLDGVYRCKNITRIELPASVMTCCEFSDCDSLTDIFVADGNSTFSSVDGVLYSRDQKTLLRCPECKTGFLDIPANTTRIDDYACAECRRLTGVKLPEHVTEIGTDAFRNCVNVTEFVLPESIIEISWGAFANVERDRIICKKGSYAYNYLEEFHSNPYWHL